MESLKTLVPSLSSISVLDCESCQLGKHHCVTFVSRVNKHELSPFMLVHSDVWGPSRVTSKLGFHCFVTFLDDHSRATWLYLMKESSE